MSAFLTPNATFRPSLYFGGDDSVRAQTDRWVDWTRAGQLAPWADAMLWPRSRTLADPVEDLVTFGAAAHESGLWESMSSLIDASGGQGRLKIRGVTRDNVGTALGSCLIQCFRTSDDLLVSECFSDAGGYYEAPTQFPGVNHYIVAYKAGSPDFAGTSLNTLQPS